MQNKTVVIGLTGIISLLCLYYLSFTFVSRSYKQKATDYATDARTGKVDLAKRQRYVDSLWNEPVYLGSTLKDVTENELNLGLDLQGGMHVMLEVSPVEIIKSLAGQSANPQFRKALDMTIKGQARSQGSFVQAFARNFREVAPGTSLASIFANSGNRSKINARSLDDQVLKMIQDEVDGATSRAFQIIQQRVDKFGVSNPNLQRIPGTGRIQVELAGVDNPERVRKLLSGAAKLEFCEVYEFQQYATAFDQLGRYLEDQEKARKASLTSAAATGTTKADTGKAASGLAAALGQKAPAAKGDSAKKDTAASASAQSALARLFQFTGNGFGVYVKDTAQVGEILRRSEVRAMFPQDLYFVYDVKPITAQNKQDLLPLTAIKRGPGGMAPLEGDVITDAQQDIDQTGRGGVEVSMSMNPEGARKWKALTAANVGKRIAILLDNYVYSAPVVNGEIPNGRSSISGNFTIEEGKDLANVLKAGKLPAPTSIVEEAVVGSTLGSEAINSGVLSSVVGLVVVLLFMLAYYNRAGMIADVALLINLFFLMGIMASLKATLTLPGIAGIVLSIGMAVDANVLIFERIKEELSLGKPLSQAIADGFRNAYSSILDSNATTLLSGLILLVFGTGLILGFAVTLVIGIFTSLFAAIFISRVLLELWTKNGRKIEFFSPLTKNLFKDSAFDFVSKRRLYYTISAIIIGAGIVSILLKGFGLGVDFKGGRTYVVRFEKGVSTDAVRDALTGTFGHAPEVKTYGNLGVEQLRITTDYLVDQTTPESDKQAETRLKAGLAKVGKADVLSSSKVGPTIADDMIWSSLKAILLGILVVAGYIFLRFRKIGFVYGAVVAVTHDVLMILAVFSIFNGLLPFNLDVDQAFVGALLTIMGYSMNDTVVVFDRVREYLRDNKQKRESIATIINNALNSTLSRTAVTGLSTLLVLIVLFIFGGETIRGFSFAMLIGVIVGTYSSLFVATPIVVDTLTREQGTKGTIADTDGAPAPIAPPKGRVKPQI
jgi:SecD/SecF fusion protein